VLKPVDVGRVGETVFLLRCGCGAIADIDGLATRELKNQMGSLAYVVAGLQKMGDLDRVPYTITCDGKVHEAEAIACIVANGGGFGGVGKLAEGVDMTDGLLDVFLFTEERLNQGPGPALAALPAALSTRDLGVPLVCSGSHIRVETPEPLTMVADGEPAGQTPIDIEVVPAAVRILVPGEPPAA
jgi:diacylglycerol kinase family enzyme